MFRGTTPTHTFTVPIESSKIKEVRVIYSQNDKSILIKKTEDATVNDNEIKVKLTQEETFKFDCNAPVQIQIRVLTTSGDALLSNPITMTVGKCLDDEVLI